MDRRRSLIRAAAFAVTATPLGTLLAACSRGADEGGPAEVHWGRDTCTHCGMVISDRRFAAQVRGGPQGAARPFDDIGCALTWLDAQPWGRDAGVRVWVAALGSEAESARWLDARRAHYTSGPQTPMGYNFGAREASSPGSLDFTALQARVLAPAARGPS